MGNKEDIAIEVISKPRPEYQSEAYAELGLPKAPAIMVGDDVIVEGRDIDEGELTREIARRLLEK